MTPEDADNMKPSRDINSKHLTLSTKREIDKNERKQIAITNLKVI